MYEKIIRAKLTFPDYLSPEAKSLLSGLLDRDPKTRLGSGPGDAEEIKTHPFFRDIDWKKLVNRELLPPFKPNTEGKEDTSNVDEEFTKEVPKDTPVQPSRLPGAKINFPNFTYVAAHSLMNNGQMPQDDDDD